MIRSSLLYPAILLLCALPSYAQTPPTKPAPKMPVIGAAFSKAAVRALLIIARSRRGANTDRLESTNPEDNKAIDAAMLEMSVAASTRSEVVVEKQLNSFQMIYDLHQFTGEHDRDYACIAAWVPKLRALSGATPKPCLAITGD